MRTLANLFGRSPFAPLQAHMDNVSVCIDKVEELFELLFNEEYKKIEKIVKQISKLEHHADLTKNDIRNNLPKGLFMPVDRGHLLEILGLQDDIADQAEDIGVLLIFKELKILDIFEHDFKEFLSKNIEAVHGVQKIILGLDELLEFSFGGGEAEKVKDMVDQVAYCEHEADLLKRKLVKCIFSHENELPYSSFYLWMRIIDAVGELSDLSEKLANRVRMTLESK